MQKVEIPKLSPVEVKQVILRAKERAAIAAEAYLLRIGGDQYPCGFAWVNIKPARGKFVTILKELGIGRTDKYYGGYTIWNPSDNFCQNMYAKEEGAKEFALELAKYGVETSVHTRLD